MSARASGYVKALTVCPNGELISAREKLVAMVLADSHQDKAKHFTYPSVDTIAAESMCDRRSCQRYLDSLERKGVIRRLRPVNQGRTYTVFYFFPALDLIPEGWQDAALLFAQRAAEGRPKGGKRAATGQLALVERAQEPEREQQQKPNPPISPSADADGDQGSPAATIDAATKRVMDAIGATARRLRRKLRAVIAHRVEMGEAADEVADRMIDAWQRYSKQGLRLYKHKTAAEFFEGPYWLDSNTWDWDTKFIREEREHAHASVGSWR